MQDELILAHSTAVENEWAVHSPVRSHNKADANAQVFVVELDNRVGSNQSFGRANITASRNRQRFRHRREFGQMRRHAAQLAFPLRERDPIRSHAERAGSGAPPRHSIKSDQENKSDYCPSIHRVSHAARAREHRVLLLEAQFVLQCSGSYKCFLISCVLDFFRLDKVCGVKYVANPTNEVPFGCTRLLSLNQSLVSYVTGSWDFQAENRGESRYYSDAQIWRPHVRTRNRNGKEEFIDRSPAVNPDADRWRCGLVDIFCGAKP